MPMTQRIDRAGLAVAKPIDDLVANEILPGLGITVDEFWAGFAAIVRDLTPRNRELLARRDELQAQIDAWHIERRGQPVDADEYRAFLTEIGYLEPEPGDFEITTAGVDDEVARRTRAGAACTTPSTARTSFRRRRDAKKARVTTLPVASWWWRARRRCSIRSCPWPVHRIVT